VTRDLHWIFWLDHNIDVSSRNDGNNLHDAGYLRPTYTPSMLDLGCPHQTARHHVSITGSQRRNSSGNNRCFTATPRTVSLLADFFMNSIAPRTDCQQENPCQYLLVAIRSLAAQRGRIAADCDDSSKHSHAFHDPRRPSNHCED
jgi:hypothetical protein